MEIYKIPSLESLSDKLILSLIERYKSKEVKRLQRLHDYYIGHADVKKRTMADPSKPNNKVANPYSAYIVDTVQGYFLGKPVSYTSDNEDLMEKLQLVYDRNHEQAHNSKMGKQLSITGIAYELMYMNEQNEIKFALLDPKEVFMVHDNSIEQKALCAVRFYDVHDYVTANVVTHIEVYTAKMVHYYKIVEGELTSEGEAPHYFKEVPVICYKNNEDAVGDFEKVIDLIDAYDLAVSDTANNLEYFADSYLVMSGVDMDANDLATMKEKRIMLLGENGKAEWLTKSAMNMEIEEFKTRIKSDIHNFSFVPNLNDEAFGSATSGESLKYKLFALENAVSIKERMFEQALEKRILLITNILNIKGGNFTHTDVTMQFTRNLPTNSTQLVDMVSKLVGIVSNETILSILPFVDDVAHEKALLEAEKADTMYENFENAVNDEAEGAGA